MEQTMAFGIYLQWGTYSRKQKFVILLGMAIAVAIGLAMDSAKADPTLLRHSGPAIAVPETIDPGAKRQTLRDIWDVVYGSVENPVRLIPTQKQFGQWPTWLKK